ncbi:hypothetical protein CI109_107231 [Kwoniella shandongensis]|uniref:ubiquitinyl hydrolase 1 n=1 Tax=Kwoniella shandongensis TaxID=1734106 RepID=A0A5M6C2F2_9TREE|nr:uncharacterized protein CI109_002514 [Kwoniella shandongensis]KAA5529173.1 hypothetical protein CI109_002514 [Kwoniella shandongensis]
MATTQQQQSQSNFLFHSALHDNSLLKELTSKPLVFGEPMPKNSWSFDVGTKEVEMGPRSPPPGTGSKRIGDGGLDSDDDEGGLAEQIRKKSKKKNGVVVPRAQTNGDVNGNGNGAAEDEEDLDDSQTTLVPPGQTGNQVTSSPSTPQTQKQKQPPSSTPKASSSSNGLYTADIDLRWPEPIAHAKRAAGLVNPSMACYANATLQVLLHTPPVLRIALAHDETNCGQKRNKGFCMLCILRGMATDSHWAGRKAYQPTDIHRNLKHLKKGFSKNRQEDTHEFFRFVTDALQATALYGKPKDLPEKLKHTSWVYRVWGGKVRSRVVCSRCNKPSDTFDDFLDLSLDVNRQGKKSISGMMTGFTREDKLEGDNKYHCDNCKAKAVATKSFKIERAPPILTLHLKRFSVNYNSYSGRARADKFNQFIEFGEYLDIAPYMVNPKVGGTKYRLFGVTCHRGVELRFGHYTSYVKGPGGQWFHADDEDMMPVKLDQVLGDKTAYLLSYIRTGEGSSSTPAKTSVGGSIPNGHILNGTSRSAPTTPHSPVVDGKRSHDEDEDESEDEEADEEDEEEEKIHRPLVKRNGFIGPSTPDAWKPIPADSPRKDEMPPELPSKFGYQPKPKSKPTPTTPLLAPKAIPPGNFYGQPSPIARPKNPMSAGESRDSHSSSLSKKERKKLRKRERKFGSGANAGGKKGAPTPFAHQKTTWKPGMLSKMKPKNK